MQTALKYISLLGKIAAGVSVYADMLPAKWALILYVVSSCLKDITNRVGDMLDDGQLNNSFKP